MKTSKVSKFYKKSLDERAEFVKDFASLSADEVNHLKQFGSLGEENADRMIENVIGAITLPLGVATNFEINGNPYMIPMALEEPSVIAAASNAAKLSSGFETESTDPIMIGQIHLVGVNDSAKAVEEIKSKEKELLRTANSEDSTLINLGGGAKKIEVNEIGKFIQVHLLVDVRDAMGANAVNTMCEKIAPELEEISGGKARLKIISNLATERIAKAKTVWNKEKIGEGTVDLVIEAYEIAKADKYRCTTHNKGAMNGMDAVVVATGNDWRAFEAGVHSYASLGSYKPITKYSKDGEGNLIGEIEIPVQLGIVGGATKINPVAGISLKILGVKSAQELGEVVAAVGLAQNFAALRALSTEGIQKGHMKLHAKNIAISAGAEGNAADLVAAKMIEEKNIRLVRAKEIVEEMKK
ncbi:MAG: hydroxymethylglutaryl-CoA reductase, degradative [Candidatus Diapherotrites archaeon]